jgi:hypothetical protein
MHCIQQRGITKTLFSFPSLNSRVEDAFAAGKMGVKLATSAPEAMKAIQAASHLAPMAPALFQAGDAALHGDFSQAALTAGTAFVPALGGKAGQR